MNKIHLIVMAVVAILSISACGEGGKPNSSNDKPVDPDSIIDFKTGNSSFFPTAVNEVMFWDLRPQAHRSRRMLFKAHRDGRLSISEASTGIATNCSVKTQEFDYVADYELKLKNRTTGAFDVDPEVSRDAWISVPLKADDELMITIKVLGTRQCRTLKLNVSGTFN